MNNYLFALPIIYIMILFIFILLVNYVNSLKIGVVGCTGSVGQEILKCLYNEKIPINDLRLFSSKSSAGKNIKTPFGMKKLDEFTVKDARECDINFLAVSGDFSKKYAKALSYGNGGSIVIDNSSAFRLDEDVPLVIPEINSSKTKNKKLIANPNCTTAIALIALFPILKEFGILKIIMSTYQAASGAGNKGMEELKEGVLDYSKNIYPPKNNVFQKPLAFNVIPHIDSFEKNGYTKEEMKVVHETRKIFDCDDIDVSCTSVRVPTFRSHCESIVIQTEKEVDIDLLKEIYSNSDVIKLMDNPSKNIYPTPISSSEKNHIEIGRIRKSLIFGDNGLEIFICGDQLLRGAAYNAVLICKSIIEKT